MHVRLVDDVRLESLLPCALGSVVADEHDLYVLLVWVRVALGVACGVGVRIAADLDLLDACVATHLGRLLVLEAAAADGAAHIRALMADHLVVHVLVRTLVRVPQLFVDIAPVSSLSLRLRLARSHVAAVVRPTHVAVRLGHCRDAWNPSATHAAAHRLLHFVCVRLVVLRMVSVTMLQHRGCILICDRTLCGS